VAVAFSRFLELDAAARLRLLTELAFEGTLDGRGAYDAGGDDVENGPALRQANEFVHRIVSLMRHVQEQTPNGDAYAEGLWTDLILPWAHRRPGRLEALIRDIEAP
jgi:hypothetical protein